MSADEAATAVASSQTQRLAGQYLGAAFPRQHEVTYGDGSVEPISAYLARRAMAGVPDPDAAFIAAQIARRLERDYAVRVDPSTLVSGDAISAVRERPRLIAARRQLRLLAGVGVALLWLAYAATRLPSRAAQARGGGSGATIAFFGLAFAAIVAGWALTPSSSIVVAPDLACPSVPLAPWSPILVALVAHAPWALGAMAAAGTLLAWRCWRNAAYLEIPARA
jgi:hypothetical protein